MSGLHLWRMYGLFSYWRANKAGDFLEYKKTVSNSTWDRQGTKGNLVCLQWKCHIEVLSLRWYYVIWLDDMNLKQSMTSFVKLYVKYEGNCLIFMPPSSRPQNAMKQNNQRYKSVRKWQKLIVFTETYKARI